MFSNPSRADPSFEEGSVTEVDVLRKMCKVKTVSGQNLSGVLFPYAEGGSDRSGDRVNIRIGNRVVIHTGLGFPYIIAKLPKLSSSDAAFPLGIDTGDELIDTGNFSEANNSVVPDPSSPRDMLVGDRVISSFGGGLIAMLRGGSVLLRASRLAEVFICKYDDLVRIVSRNWEQFTDVSSEVIKNIAGRVYKYTGFAQNFSNAKIENYVYHQYSGDVALAEVATTDYTNVGSLPATTDVVYKEQVTTGSGGGSSELLSREIHLDGTHDLVIKGGGGFTRIKNTNGEVLITFNDTNIIRINADEIFLEKGGGPNLLMDSTGIKAVFQSHFITIDSSGVKFG